MQDINQLSFSISGSAGGASKSLNTLISKLGKLDEAFTKSASSGRSLVEVLNGISNISKGVSSQMGVMGANTKKATASVAQMNRGMKTVTASTNRATRSLHNNSLSINNLVKRVTQLTFVVYALKRAFNFAVEGIQMAIAYVENLNLFMVALGKNTSRAGGFIREMSDSLYLDEAQLTRVQGLFYQISESLGLSSERAYTLSENFSKLAYDLASFYNLTVDEAVIKLQAGLVGETEPLRRIGIIITENNLAETARTLGIEKSIRMMTEQEKIQLRYVTALQQTKNAQGDLARTIEQPENLLRILREQLHKFVRELGNSAIPMIKKVAVEMIGMVRALTTLSVKIAEIAGYDRPELRNDMGGYMKTVSGETEEASKSSGEFVKNLAKALKYTRDLSSVTTGIDELNIVSPSGGAITGFDSLFSTDDAEETKSALDLLLESYDNLMSESKGIFDSVTEKWQTRIEDIIARITPIAMIFKNIFLGVVDGVNEFASEIETVYDTILKPLFDLVAPDWLETLTGEDFRETVANLTKMFLVWKTLSIGLTAVNFVKHIAGIKNIAGLTTMFTAMASIKLVLDVVNASVEGDWGKVKDILFDAIVAGFAGVGVAVITRSGSLGLLTFSILTSLEFNPIDYAVEKTNNLLDRFESKYVDDAGVMWGEILKDVILQPFVNIANILIYGLNLILKGVNKLIPFEKWDAKLIPEISIDEFANGGKPQKGSLFIAGEAGAELVGDFGNGTSVINQKQMKDLGIPMYADGVNVPRWKFDAPERNEKTQEIIGVTTNLNRAFKEMGEILSGITGSVGKGVLKVFETVGNAKISKTVGKVFGWFGDFGKDVASVSSTFMGGLDSIAKGFMNTDLMQGLKRAVGNFIDAILNTDTVVGKLYKGFKSITKASVDVVVALYDAFKSDKGLQQIMSQPPEGGGSTLQQQDAMGGIMSSMMSGSPAGMIFDTLMSISDGVMLNFVSSLPQFVQAGMDMLLNLIDGVIEALPALMKEIPKVITKIVEIITNKDSLNSLINGFIMIFVEIAKALPDIIFALTSAIPDIIMTLIEVFIENLPMFAKLGILIAVSLVNGLVNAVIAGINSLIKMINKIPFVDIGYLKPVDFTTATAEAMGFAEGGYPQQGQMFIAREAGAELVGNVGGRTAVMNNEQIVESVARGVYEAVRQAMAETGERQTIVNLDGKRVSERLEVANKNRGLSFGTGGY